MKSTPLHPQFGIEVHGVKLRRATQEHLYPEIRTLFEKHSLLLFRDQHLNDEEHCAFAYLFGPLEDRSTVRMDGIPEISYVSNVADDGSVYGESEPRLLELKSNMLWHTDSTFLPIPALANVLQARVVPLEGGATEFVSTRAGFKALATENQERLRHLFFWHRYGHSRSRIDPHLAKLDKFTMWPDQKWRVVWRNPLTGEGSLYIASHAFAVDGMDQTEGAALIDSLLEVMTPPHAVYSHAWEPGDVLVWDERAMLHRGTPWPYDQPRTLVSTCVSARDVDGLASMKSPEIQGQDT